MDTPQSFTISDKGDKFCDFFLFLFFFCTPIYLSKKIFSKREEFTPLWFTLKGVDHFSEGNKKTKSVLRELSPLNVYQFPLKLKIRKEK